MNARLVVKTLLFLPVFVMATTSLSSVEILHDPLKIVAPGVNAGIEFTPSEINKVVRAAVFARTSGTGAYLSFPMLGSGRLYKAEIPGSIIQIPGLEYYIEATTTDGATITFPSQNAAQNPVFSRIVQSNPAPIVRIISPQPDELVDNNRPIISVLFKNFNNAIDFTSLKWLIDGIDVSANVKINSEFAQYKPPLELQNGKHTVTVSIKDTAGNASVPVTWSFYTGSKEAETLSDEDKKKSLSGNLLAI